MNMAKMCVFTEPRCNREPVISSIRVCTMTCSAFEHAYSFMSEEFFGYFFDQSLYDYVLSFEHAYSFMLVEFFHLF